MSDWLYMKDQGGYFRTYIHNEWFNENRFTDQPMEGSNPPSFEEARPLLPAPIWEGHRDAVDCYWRSWEIAFRNLRRPTKGSGLIANYIDPAFNGNMFMWDSVFMLMFGLYGNRAFSFQHTLNNFYAKQHPDGFICREINEETGNEQFHRYDPSSTGPNLFAWSEWTYFQLAHDRRRLGAVFPVIAGYHRWMRYFRTWPDGSYYSTGWGCGMDNQPRIPKSLQIEFYHGHMSWVDTTLQHLLSVRLLVQMAEVLERRSDAEEFVKEADDLQIYVNSKMWDEKQSFYYDRSRTVPCPMS